MIPSFIDPTAYHSGDSPSFAALGVTGLSTLTGGMVTKTVNDSGPMTATNGTTAEIVFNSADSKFYGCTAGGTPGTWAALN